MAKKGMFSNEITKCCALCEKATKLQDVNTVLCRKRGVVSSEYCCAKFSYDPLKRVPRRITVMTDYSPEDFSIE